MRKITEVLRLDAQGVSTRQVATSVGIGRATVAEYLARAQAAGLSWPLPESLDATALEAALFPAPVPVAGRPLPDWRYIHKQLKAPRHHVTLRLVWIEWRADHPDLGQGLHPSHPGPGPRLLAPSACGRLGVLRRRGRRHRARQSPSRGHYYSVPHRYVRQKVEMRITAATVEVLRGGVRIASHPREYGRRRYVTDPAHMPPSHRAHLEWTPERLVSWAAPVSGATAALVEAILESRPHPEHAQNRRQRHT